VHAVTPAHLMVGMRTGVIESFLRRQPSKGQLQHSGTSRRRRSTWDTHIAATLPTHGLSNCRSRSELHRNHSNRRQSPLQPRSRRRGLLTVSVAAVTVIALMAIVLVIATSTNAPVGQSSHQPASASSNLLARASGRHHAHSLGSQAAASLKVRVCTTPAISCVGKGGTTYMQAMPRQIVISGEGSALVNDITWSNWGKATATGAGTLEIDNCNPDCANGAYTGYPATIRLSSLLSYGSAKAYSDMTVMAPTVPGGAYHFRSGLVP
jgi:hypothetical protein